MNHETHETPEHHTTHHDLSHDKTHTHHTTGTHKTSSTRSKYMDGLMGFVADIEKLCDEYLVAKAPYTLPSSLTAFLVKAAPYLTIIMLIVALPVVLALIGFGAIFGVVAPVAGFLFLLTSLLTAFAFALQAMAVKPLFARAKKGWNLMFYAALVSFVASLMNGSLVSSVIGAVLGLYVLFQVKSLYK